MDLSSGQYVSEDKYKDLEIQLDRVNSALADKTAEYDSLKSKAGDNAELKDEIERLKTEHADTINGLKTDYAKQLKRSAVINEIERKYHPKDVTDIMPHIPNVTNVPNINVDCDSKAGLVNVDISNVRGEVGYLQYARLGDLKLSCNKIIEYGLNSAYIDSLDTGDYCTNIEQYALANSKVKQVKLGISATNIGSNAFTNCQALRTITFNNFSGVTINNFAFLNCTSLATMNFKAIKSISYGNWLNNDISITTLTFIPKSIACALYFNASAVLSEQSCINIINAIADGAKISVSLDIVVKDKMTNLWYCKLSGDSYVSCIAEDEGAVTQAEALIERGGTLI